MIIKKVNEKIIIILFAIFISINFIIKFINREINIKQKIEFLISYIKMKKEFRQNKKYISFISNNINKK